MTVQIDLIVLIEAIDLTVQTDLTVLIGVIGLTVQIDLIVLIEAIDLTVRIDLTVLIGVIGLTVQTDLIVLIEAIGLTVQIDPIVLIGAIDLTVQTDLIVLIEAIGLTVQIDPIGVSKETASIAPRNSIAPVTRLFSANFETRQTRVDRPVEDPPIDVTPMVAMAVATPPTAANFQEPSLALAFLAKSPGIQNRPSRPKIMI